ncbi:ER membrane protein complex subunit-like protein [Hapsidospora chrysogenum ATCC 11550]|uniref:ER membrane protein complex subunit-like protein n=1 Tax=Hapsidospora chrysogenum (strain ATCC 11550 / CBS 779.69 / DSM 880 / IAM 14645 / JCM 23072 / IMI 49137) TaxID=857340 RepID=A0A086SVI5_HAPC1|nr:ER membrane protein complex subunit-like protein [Hapsidospora chrysogenum ATCC 11550]
MAWIPRLITLTGLVLLAHAGYSAQEHAVFTSAAAQHSLSTPNTSRSLPLDICLETLFSTLLVSLGLVMGSPKLRPIRWNVWAGKIEREGAAGFRNNGGEVDKDFRGNPFGVLEARPGFVDIRKQRQEFAEWTKGQSK